MQIRPENEINRNVIKPFRWTNHQMTGRRKLLNSAHPMVVHQHTTTEGVKFTDKLNHGKSSIERTKNTQSEKTVFLYLLLDLYQTYLLSTLKLFSQALPKNIVLSSETSKLSQKNVSPFLRTSENYRIIECFGLGGTLKIIELSPLPHV